MTESFDDRLTRAGRVDVADAATRDALAAVVLEARPSARRTARPRLAPAIAIGAALALAAPVAVAAAQWGPWTFVTDPDLVITRSWADVDGTPLGTCETALAVDELPESVRADVLDYIASLDVDAIEPDAEMVASGLNSVGRLDDVGLLVDGAQPSDFNVSHSGELLDAAFSTDARILQDSLVSTIGRDVAEAMLARHPDALMHGFASTSETQCSAAPETQQP